MVAQRAGKGVRASAGSRGATVSMSSPPPTDDPKLHINDLKTARMSLLVVALTEEAKVVQNVACSHQGQLCGIILGCHDSHIIQE